MYSARAGSSTCTTRSPSVDQNYGIEVEETADRSPGKRSSAATVMVVVPTPEVPQRQQNQVYSPQRSYSPVPVPPSRSSRRTEGFSRNIPYHTASAAPVRQIRSWARAAPRGRSQPQPQPAPSHTLVAHQNVYPSRATAGATSQPSDRSRQLSSSGSLYRPGAVRTDRHSRETQTPAWGGVRVSGPLYSAHPSSLSSQPRVKGATAVFHRQNVSPSPTITYQLVRSVDLPNTVSRSVASTASPLPPGQLVYLAQEPRPSPAQQHIVYLESMDTIPTTDAAPKLRPHPVTVVQDRGSSSPVPPSTWNTIHHKNDPTAAVRQKQSSLQAQSPSDLSNQLISGCLPILPPSSLLFAQHRHVRLSFPGSRSAAPLVTYPHYPPPPPAQGGLYKSPTTPTAHPERESSRDMRGVVTEADSTCNRYTRYPCGTAPVTASGIPVGSPYGATPTCVVTTPLSDILSFPRKSRIATPAHQSLPTSEDAAAWQQHSSAYPVTSSRLLLEKGRDDASGVQQRALRTWREGTPTQPSGHQGGPATSLPWAHQQKIQGQSRYLTPPLHRTDEAVSAHLARAAPDGAMKLEWKKYSHGHDKDDGGGALSLEANIDTRMSALTEEERWHPAALVTPPAKHSTPPALRAGGSRPYLEDVMVAAPPPDRRCTDSSRCPTSSQGVQLLLEGSGNTDEQPPTAARVCLIPAENAAAGGATSIELFPQTSPSPQRHSEEAGCEDDVDELAVINMLTSPTASRASSAHSVPASSGTRGSDCRSQSPVFDGRSSSHPSTHAFALLQSTTPFSDSEERWSSRSSSAVAAAAPGRRVYPEEEVVGSPPHLPGHRKKWSDDALHNHRLQATREAKTDTHDDAIDPEISQCVDVDVDVVADEEDTSQRSRTWAVTPDSAFKGAGEEVKSSSPVIRKQQVYADPLQECIADTAYILHLLEQQYVRINEDTNEEMEDLMHVMELNRRDRAAAQPRTFVAKGQFFDVLPMLRYPADRELAEPLVDTATDNCPSSVSRRGGEQLTYAPLTEAAYINLCATMWLSRFDPSEVQGLLATARGPVGGGDGDETRACSSTDTYYLDYPSAHLCETLDLRISAYVRGFLSRMCARGDCDELCRHEAVCVRLTDNNNLDCLPRSVWAAAAPQTLSFADHVTNVLLAATVPHEAEGRRAAAAEMATSEEVLARRTWQRFLGASPWNYEIASENGMCTAMPPSAARLAYAFLFKARMRNLDGGIGSMMFSMLCHRLSEVALVDWLLMQEKLCWALLCSNANILACCSLRQQSMGGQPLRISVAEAKGAEALSARGSFSALSSYHSLDQSSTAHSARRRSDEALEGPRHRDAGKRTMLCRQGCEGRVDLYSVAVQLKCFFPMKTQRGLHQLCAALIEDLIRVEAFPMPEKVVTSEGVVLTDPLSIADALVVEGTQAIEHLLAALSANGERMQTETVDSYRTLDGNIDTAAVRTAMEKHLVLLDPAAMFFLRTPVPVMDFFEYVLSDGPPSLQPQATGRKSAFVEVLRLQHIAETVQYTMDMQDAILVAGQLDNFASAAQRQGSLTGQRDGGLTHTVGEERLLNAVTVGKSSEPIQCTDISAALLAERTTGDDGQGGTDRRSFENMFDANASGGGGDVSVRAVLISLCCADPQKPLAEVQEYLRHLLVLYFELHTPDGSTVDSSDPYQVGIARLMASDMTTWDWFGDTEQSGMLRAGASPAWSDDVRITAEVLASLCPRVLGRRVGVPSSTFLTATAAIIAASTLPVTDTAL